MHAPGFRATAGSLFLALLAAHPGRAQSLFGEDHPTQIHGFASQGFAYTNDNNYLTMPTSTGSFALTDAGVNVTTVVTDKFRVGAQVAVRNLGALDRGHFGIDWASGDYHFKDWFGIRGGKVKTVLGLHNETQDLEFLNTWILLPQSVYPLDLRTSFLAHWGGDIYGRVPIRAAGALAYTVYGGYVPYGSDSGYFYSLKIAGIKASKVSGTVRGADLKWTTPVRGLLAGVSALQSPLDATGTATLAGFPAAIPFVISINKQNRTIGYIQYAIGGLRIEGEYSRETNYLALRFALAGTNFVDTATADERAWYTAVSYRISKHVEIGTYNSRFFPNADLGAGQIPPAGRHLFDQTVTARFDFAKYFDLKVEEHFLNGYGDTGSVHGFYVQDNPNGLKPRTDLFLVRAGVSF